MAKPVPTQSRIIITYRSISDLTTDPKNARQHSARQIAQIARSIEAFGFNVPLLIDADNKIVAGHGRVLACKALGIERVPTVRLEHLSAAQLRAFAIADNRLTEVATWNDHLLAQQLRELSEVELDFSLEATGFEMGEIDFRIQSFSGQQQNDESVDAIPPIENGPTVTEKGDVWVLGPHRLVCGDARDPAAYELLLGEKRAAMVCTDPPYNVRIDGHAGGLGKIRHGDFVMAAGEMSEDEYTAFLSQACKNLVRFSVDGAIHFLFIDWRHIGELLRAGDAYTELKNLCVWAKDNGGMGSLYRSRHELVFVFKSGRAPHINNVRLGQYGRYRSNVWEYAGVNSFARSTDEGNLLERHPTPKPVAMIADAMLDCSNRGDIVLDAFLGSGTTLIAAERTGRLGYALELDPHYVDTAIRRWQKHTGQQARHALSGRFFDDVAAGRKPGASA